MLTFIVVVDSHVSRCCVHDLIKVCRERFLVAGRQQVALFLQLCNQLQGDEREINHNLSREVTPVFISMFTINMVD